MLTRGPVSVKRLAHTGATAETPLTARVHSLANAARRRYIVGMRRATRERLFGRATLVLGLSITACSGEAVDADRPVMPAATTSAQEPPAVPPEQPGQQAEFAPMDSDATSAVSREPDPPRDRCLWETEDLLSRIDAQSPALIDCGLFLGEQPLENECFTNGLLGSDSVQITINNCIDCMIHSTYVSTSSGRKVHLYREADYYGDDVRVVRVDACTTFVPGQGPGANCAAPATLYTCSDPLPDPSSL